MAPESPWILTEYSSLVAQEGQPFAALQYVDKALALHPHFRPAVHRKVHYLHALQRDEEALHLLESAFKHLQHHAIAVELLLIHSEQENWTQSLQMIQEARRLAPLADKAFETFCAMKEADARAGLKDWPGAAAQAEKAASVEFYAILGRTLRGQIPAACRVKIPVPFVQQQYLTCAPATLSAITAVGAGPSDKKCWSRTSAMTAQPTSLNDAGPQSDGWCVESWKRLAISKSAPRREDPVHVSRQAEIGWRPRPRLLSVSTTVRRSYSSMRDPSVRHYTEAAYDEFLKHYEAVGPRGLLLCRNQWHSFLQRFSYRKPISMIFITKSIAL